MKKFAFVGIGAVAGFVGALGILPAAHGANDMSAYRELDLKVPARKGIADPAPGMAEAPKNLFHGRIIAK